MRKRLTVLSVCLTAFLSLYPFFAVQNAQAGETGPEPQVQSVAVLLRRAPAKESTANVPPLVPSLPMPGYCAIKPFLLLIAIVAIRRKLRMRLSSALQSLLSINAQALRCYADHPHHAPPPKSA